MGQDQITQRPVKVRFAPSPTGFLHVGGARTALYNWLYAKRQGGKLVLRIEDTDNERSSEEYVEAILDSMKWMGLDWDEGPFYQTKRLDIYKEQAQKLIDQGVAKKLDDGTEAVIFIFPKEGQTIFGDLIHGKISFEHKDIKDQVLIKSDGYPAYSFACVVDDALMDITHVIRGDDHISNTPKQIAIYEALGFKVPKFAHIPLIMGSDNARLSKRHGATSVSHYRDLGYLPEAFVNFLALLGWSAGDNKELMSLEELQKKFSLKRVTGKSAIFDHDKIQWMNAQYIKEAKPETLVASVKRILEQKNLYNSKTMTDEWLKSLLVAFKGRIKILSQLTVDGLYLFSDEYPVDAEALKKYSDVTSQKILADYLEWVQLIEPFDLDHIEEKTKAFCKDKNVTFSELVHPMRVALSGKTVTPGIYDVLYLVGKERVIERLKVFSLS
jgi:glutamyl-tRNA synthetase